MPTNSNIHKLSGLIFIIGNKYISIILLCSFINTAKAQSNTPFVNDTTATGIVNSRSVMPIHIMDFSSANVNCNAQLQWTTTNEIDGTKYYVEQSKDGISYKQAIVVNSTSPENAYSIVIPQPNGIYYYRLLLKNERGDTLDFSNTILCNIKCDTDENLKTYPNPIYKQPIEHISITTTYRGKISLVISNQLGKKIFKLKNKITDPNCIIPIGVSILPQAIYYITIITDPNCIIPIGVSILPQAIYYITILKEDGTQLGAVQKFIKL
ncbi:MAG: hypothetical protein WDM90_23500 [Ferruginibacter sp.]